MRLIDNKHHIEGEQIVKSSNGQIIPSNEPLILFRGRDKLALSTLKFYRDLCINDNCTSYQLNSLDTMIAKFESFAQKSPTMKQPGITLGK